MKILIACEFSGIVRNSFIEKGHDAISCDILPSEKPGPHYQCDVRLLLSEKWDMMLAFPPCTFLCVSGARWFSMRKKEQLKAISFFMELWNSPIDKICIENPVGIMSTILHKPSQYIQPWMFGHGETKKTGLWLKNLPLLHPTNIVDGRENRIHKMSPGIDRGKKRSYTYTGIAKAMSEQWG